MQRHIGDNPSDGEQLAVLVDRSVRITADIQEIKATLKEHSDAIARLGLLQREQNSNVAKAVERQTLIEQWENTHTGWHGKNDELIGQRIGVLELRDHDQAVIHGVWLSQWKALTASAVMGATLATLLGNTHAIYNWFFGATGLVMLRLLR